MATPIITSINPLIDNPTYQNTTTSNKFYSSKLLNYVEPIEIGGFIKTVFYSELNTNFNINDRIFIVNGNYDSNDFILQNKYTKYTDGYRVLGVDGCRIILDIEYSATLPYIEPVLDNLIKVYHIQDQREFDYINSIKVNIEPISVTNSVNTIVGGITSTRSISKFSGQTYQLTATSPQFTAVLFSDSIIYVDDAFNSSAQPHNLNSGVLSSGFYIRNDSAITPQWIDITSLFYSNYMKVYNSNYTIDNNIHIIGEDIDSNTYLKQRTTYKYVSNNWEIDIKYKQALISKSNFRFGKFKGKHNDGIFGTNIRKNTWNSATWNSGIFLNSNWINGSMNSKSILGDKSYYSNLKILSGTTSIPVQTIDFSNNRSFGYNIILDSNLYKGNLLNGNFENCNVGLSSSYSALDIYFGLTQSYEMTIGGKYNLCDINSVNSDNSTINNSELVNSLLINSSIVNSQVINTVSNKSKYSDNDSIKIIAADLWSYNTTTSLNDIRGILKLYIDDSNITKFNIGDAFYLTKINKEYYLNSLTKDERILLPFETKYIFDNYFDYELSSNKLIVSIKSKNDNKVKSIVKKTTNIISPTYINIFSDNIYNYSSIDIDCAEFGWYERTTQAVTSLGGGITTPSLVLFTPVSSYVLYPVDRDNVNKLFTNIDIKNSDYKSGYFNNSTWVSGDNINYFNNKINKLFSNLYISYISQTTISINLNLTQMNPNIPIYGEDLFVGDKIWLNSISLFDSNFTEKKIDGRYNIISIQNNLTNREIFIQSEQGLTFSPGTFSIVGAEYSNYNSISKFSINNSKIESGLFKRTNILNSTFINSEFDSTDKTLKLNNINKLRIINLTFKDTNNTINSGLIYKSHFINDIWNNGILFNSIWNGGIFNNGIVNNSYWKNGTFNNGSFIDSKDITTTTQTYDDQPNYRNWVDGTFNMGEFYNSSWSKGIFNNGRFHNSDWYSGTWNNGVLGSSTLQFSDTKFGYYSPLTISTFSSIWNNGIVDNALIGGSGSVYWFKGKFNNGEITSFGTNSNNETIWLNGDFNGGKFTDLARWRNGNFNKGKFLSHYGYTNVSPTNPSTQSFDYGWENGKFNGGEFGNASLGTNSVWFNGEFNGGIFIGRFWNNGIFSKGDFIGSGTYSLYSSNISSINEYNYVNSYTNSYYGLWNNGYVTDNPQNIKVDERVYTELTRKSEEKTIDDKATLKNMLWLNGTFNHKNAIIQNSIWLDGNFYDGDFDSSIFNAYVDRQFLGLYSNSSFASTSSCVWHNGKFNSTFGTGSFYISEWKNGTFNKGYMSGATWKNGVWNYGTAENIYWENGLWRNGNWNGTPFDYSYLIDDVIPGLNIVDEGRTKDILMNTSLSIGTTSLHLLNVFSASIINANVLTDVAITSLNTSTSSWTYSQEIYQRIIGYTQSFINGLPIPETQFGNTSIWAYSPTFSINNTQYAANTHVYTFGGDPNIPQFRTSIIPGYNWTQFDNIPESSVLFAEVNNNNDIDVFTNSNSSYEIKLELTVELTPEVYIMFKLGDTTPFTLTFSSTLETIGLTSNYWPKQYNLTFVYNTPTTFTNNIEKQFYIKKLDGGIIRLLKGSISEKVYIYNNQYNNTLYRAIQGNDIRFPSLTPLASSDNGSNVSVYYGNGVFRSGIWENGIWNNGLRSNAWFSSREYYRFENIIGVNGISPTNDKNTYQIDDKTWLVTLKSIDPLLGLTIGDKVSIGNLVAIDINESRKLIKDYYTIVEIDDVNSTIVIKLVTNFPIRRIEKDSSNHLIYITKNIWLSGAFLNGYFSGVWNNGLFKGSPYITLMTSTHWTDGKFDGGRFVSRTINDIQTNRTYNTGLLQNLTFADNPSTLLGQPIKYLSWMDVNYGSSSMTNINQDTLVYTSENAFNAYTYSYYENINNMYGYITNDILESKSTFRSIDTLNKTDYKLGIKYTTYDNLIPNSGLFNTPFSNNTNGLNMDNFYLNSWIYSDITNNIANTYSLNPTYELYLEPSDGFKFNSNISLNTNNKFRLFSASSSSVYEWIAGTYNQTKSLKIILNNDNIDTIKNRYYLAYLDLASYSIIPGSVSAASSSSTYSYLSMNKYVNELETPSNIKTQYFYNKQNLELTIDCTLQSTSVGIAPSLANPTFSLFPSILSENVIDISFNEISFYEVDMIPFFKYWTQSNIDEKIKVPYFAIAPFIDYSNSNFDFIGNVNVTIDSDSILGQNISSTVVSANGINGSVDLNDGTIEGTSPNTQVS
jgi:hypothetical protein